MVLVALVDNIRVCSRGTKPRGGALGRVQACRFNKLYMLYRRDYYLRDASSAPDDEFFRTEIYKNDL